jgi:endonuclease/exonuclease/phosphatase family metal-dependent hydrolase
VLWNTRSAHLEWLCEGAFDDEEVQNKALFDRQPLLAYFRLFSNGVEMNDLVVVGVHLASGQNLNRNHDEAMSRIGAWLADERGSCIPAAERDILIAGDFNANRFENPVEQFWNTMEGSGWDVLADDPAYPPTRLTQNPPAQVPGKSQIDYIIVSRGPGALAGEEVGATQATVHSDLVAAAGGGLAFRRTVSDHLPVTIRLAVVADTD